MADKRVHTLRLPPRARIRERPFSVHDVPVRYTVTFLASHIGRRPPPPRGGGVVVFHGVLTSIGNKPDRVSVRRPDVVAVFSSSVLQHHAPLCVFKRALQ